MRYGYKHILISLEIFLAFEKHINKRTGYPICTYHTHYALNNNRPVYSFGDRFASASLSETTKDSIYYTTIYCWYPLGADQCIFWLELCRNTDAYTRTFIFCVFASTYFWGWISYTVQTTHQKLYTHPNTCNSWAYDLDYDRMMVMMVLIMISWDTNTYTSHALVWGHYFIYRSSSGACYIQRSLSTQKIVTHLRVRELVQWWYCGCSISRHVGDIFQRYIWRLRYLVMIRWFWNDGHMMNYFMNCVWDTVCYSDQTYQQ